MASVLLHMFGVRSRAWDCEAQMYGHAPLLPVQDQVLKGPFCTRASDMGVLSHILVSVLRQGAAACLFDNDGHRHGSME